MASGNSVGNFRQDLTNVFNNVIPNFIGTTAAGEAYIRSNPKVSRQLNEAVMGNVGGISTETEYPKIDSVFRSADVPTDLLEQQERCKAMTIENAISSVDPQAKYRCGWLYQRDPTSITPKISTGWLGSRDGPLNIFNQEPQGRWFWDLEAARKQMLMDGCANVTTCQHLASPLLAGKCGYCKSSQKGFPVGPTGQPLYPGEIGGNCSVADTVRRSADCPVPVPRLRPVVPGMPPQPSTAADVCTPSVDGRLSQNCLIQQVKLAGCSDRGSLVQSLREGGTPSDYLAKLRTKQAFNVFQDRAPVKLNDSILKDGKIGADMALANFTNVYNQAQARSRTALQVAATDLCMSAGVMESFDFCTEIADTQRPPFALDCMQKEFRKAGGAPAGAAYPSESTLGNYQAYPTWGSYKQYIADLAAKTRSTDPMIQAKALQDFLGISREILSAPKVPGVNAYELFSFRMHQQDDALFMGRTFADGQDGFPIIANSAQLPPLSGPTDSSFVIVSDLRPPKTETVQFTVPVSIFQGVSMTINTDRERMQERNASGPNDFRRDFPIWPGSQTNPSCTVLAKSGRNYFKTYFNNKFGSLAKFQVDISNCAPNAPKNKLPGAWINLSQEVKAPMLSFEVRARSLRGRPAALGMHEYRMPEFFIADNSAIFVEDRPSNLAMVPNRMRYITFESTESKWELNKLMSSDAWTSMTFCFKLNRPNKAAREAIFAARLGPLAMFSNNNGTVTLEIDGQKLLNIPMPQGKWYVLYLQKEHSGGFRNNRISVGIVEPTFTGDVRSGLTSRTWSSNNPISPSGFNIFSFGKDSAAPVSSGFSMAWLRFYDYPLTNADLVKDFQNKWIRDWSQE